MDTDPLIWILSFENSICSRLRFKEMNTESDRLSYNTHLTR